MVASSAIKVVQSVTRGTSPDARDEPGIEKTCLMAILERRPNCVLEPSESEEPTHVEEVS
jgi:hypothetical protein